MTKGGHGLVVVDLQMIVFLIWLTAMIGGMGFGILMGFKIRDGKLERETTGVVAQNRTGLSVHEGSAEGPVWQQEVNREGGFQ